MSTNRTKREKLVYYLSVVDNITEAPLGRLADLTNEGLLIICDKAIDNLKQLDVKILFKDPILNETSLSLKIQSRWSKQDQNPQLFNVGFKILSSSTNNASQIIALLIEQMGIETEE